MNVCVKMVAHLPVHEVILARSLVSFLACVLPLWRLGIHPLGNNRFYLLLRGIAGFGSLSLYFYTLQRIPLATAVTLQYLAPLFTAVMSWRFLGENISPMRWGSFFISLTGVALATNFDPHTPPLFAFLGVASALLAAIAYYSISQAKASEHPLVIVLYFPLVAIPVTTLLCLWEFRWPVGSDWLWLLLTGIFTQAAQVLMTRGYMEEYIGKAAGLKYSGVLFALLWGWLFFGDHYEGGRLWGLMVLLAGTAGHVLFR